VVNVITTWQNKKGAREKKRAPSVVNLRDSRRDFKWRLPLRCWLEETSQLSRGIQRQGPFYLRVSPGIAQSGFAPSVSGWQADLFPVVV
jgi:hypothetical protein